MTSALPLPALGPARSRRVDHRPGHGRRMRARAGISRRLSTLSDGTPPARRSQLHGPGDVTGHRPARDPAQRPATAERSPSSRTISRRSSSTPRPAVAVHPCRAGGAGPPAARGACWSSCGRATVIASSTAPARLLPVLAISEPADARAELPDLARVVGVGARADVHDDGGPPTGGRSRAPGRRQPQPTGVPATAQARHHVPRLRRPGVRAGRATRPRPAR